MCQEGWGSSPTLGAGLLHTRHVAWWTNKTTCQAGIWALSLSLVKLCTSFCFYTSLLGLEVPENVSVPIGGGLGTFNTQQCKWNHIYSNNITLASITKDNVVCCQWTPRQLIIAVKRETPVLNIAYKWVIPQFVCISVMSGSEDGWISRQTRLSPCSRWLQVLP